MTRNLSFHGGKRFPWGDFLLVPLAFGVILSTFTFFLSASDRSSSSWDALMTDVPFDNSKPESSDSDPNSDAEAVEGVESPTEDAKKEGEPVPSVDPGEVIGSPEEESSQTEKEAPEKEVKTGKKGKRKESLASLSVEERLERMTPVPEAEAMVLERLVPTKMLTNRNVLKAVMRTPRALFVPKDLRDYAYQDITLPIGASQTISPPFVVAYMTEQLNPQPTDKVLEIGTGSGYQAAVLSPLVSEVFTIEIVPSLGKKATETLKDLGYDNVFVKIGDGYQGWEENAPYDKIIVTCSPENIPKPLTDQLAEGGQLLIPIGERYEQYFYRVTKTNGELVKETLIPAFFVPMTGEAEKERQIQPDPANPSIRGGTFEDAKDGLPQGWYYTRNVKVMKDLTAPEGESVLVFDNWEVKRNQRKKDALLRKELTERKQSETPEEDVQPVDLVYDDLTIRQRYEELTAHTLQGFPVDGRKVKKLDLSCFMEGSLLESFFGRQTVTTGVVVFFDENREAIAETTVFAIKTGNSPWDEYSRTEVAVPKKAREGSLRIGILDGIGVLKIDRIELKKHEK